MADLNLSPDYFQHPKTRRLVGLLGNGSDVLPLRLWAYCAKYHPKDGRLAGYSAQEIESLAGWWGHAGKMIETLVSDKCQFLHKEKDGYRIHDWEQHQGHIEPLRQRAQNAANVRWERERAKARGEPPDATSNAPGIAPSLPSVPDQTKPKRGKTPDPLPALPPELDTPEFRPVFDRWRKHREEIRKPLKPTMAEAQYRKFSAWGVPHAISVIEHTISNGWWGLVEPQPKRSANGSAKPTRDELEDARVERLLT